MVLVVKNPPANVGDVGDVGSIPGSGRSPGGGHGNPLQSSCLEKPKDGGGWWATVRGAAEADRTERAPSLFQQVSAETCIQKWVLTRPC